MTSRSRRRGPIRTITGAGATTDPKSFMTAIIPKRLRHTIVLAGLCGGAAFATTSSFQVDEVASARHTDIAQIKAGTVAFSDHIGGAGGDAALIRFEDWANQRPNEKKYLALYPSYSEPPAGKSSNGRPAVEKLYMYVAQARFVLDRAPGAVDLTRYVNLNFLERIDPAIKHTQIAAADPAPFKGDAIAGNDNPDRKWCTGRPALICIQSVYKLEGKIPLGIMLVNKLRDSEKKIADHIDFQSELSALGPADVDQAGLQQLTDLNTPIVGVLEQNLFYINQILKFGKFFAVFQNHPTDAGKTVVTAFMALAIKTRVLEERRNFEKVPVLRNLVPAQVLMGQSSFNSGTSISAGLPKYARNEIRTVAGLLANAN